MSCCVENRKEGQAEGREAEEAFAIIRTGHDNVWSRTEVVGFGEDTGGLETHRRWNRGAWLTGCGGRIPPRTLGWTGVGGWDISFPEGCQEQWSQGRARQGENEPWGERGRDMVHHGMGFQWEGFLPAALCGRQVGKEAGEAFGG